MHIFSPNTRKVTIVTISLFVLGLFFISQHNAEAAASFVASGAARTVTSGNLTSVTVPSGIASNDILVVVMHSRDNVVSTMPAGWTLKVAGNGNSTNRLSVWWKRTTGTESAPTITHTAGNAAIARIHAFRGIIATGDPFDVIGSVQSNAGTPISTTAITTTISGDMILHAFGSQDYNGWGTFTGVPTTIAGSVTSTNNSGANDNSLALTYGLQGTFGTTGAAGATQSSRGPDAGVSVQLALKPILTTTLGNGTDPGNTALAPGGVATMGGAFTFITNGGTDNVTAVVVGLASGTFGGLSLVEVTNDTGTVVYGSVANPTSNTPTITLTTPITVTTSSTQYKIRITPRSHANMPVPPGASYASTAKINSWTSTNPALGTDTAGTTVTIDNLSPSGATSVSGSAGNAQITLNWTTSATADFSRSVMLRWIGGSAGSEVPAEGTDYTIGNTITTATIACVRSTDGVSTPVSGVDGAGTGGCSATPLTNGQAYTYKVFQKDSNGNYNLGTSMGTFTPVAPANTTIIADGTNPSSVSIIPGGSITDLDTFTLATSPAGTDSVTGLTVTLTGTNSYQGLSEVRITDNSGATTYFSAVTNPSSNTVAFSGGTPIPVTTGATAYKVRVTPRSHTNMPVPPGATYTVGGTITAFTSANGHSGTDGASATITIDNLSPSGATSVSGSAGSTQVTLNWTTSASADFSRTVTLRWASASAGSEAPAEGTDYSAGNSIGAATVACMRTIDAPSTSLTGTDGAGLGGCTGTPLTNGQAYTYKVFQKDYTGNYDAGVLMGTFTPSPAPTTTLGSGSDPVASTIAPETSATDANTFTLQTNTGTETVSSVTVNLSTNNGIGLLAITDNSNSVLGSTASPTTGSNVISVSGMSAGTSEATFKVRITPLSHTAMPAVPGGTYAITAQVTAWAGSYVHSGSDADTNSLTIDNASPADVSSASGSAGNAQVTLDWTNPTDTDYHSTVALRRAGSAIGDTPIEGVTYSQGNTIGSAIVACVIGTPTASCINSGLTNGISYYYKIFSKDSNGNYSAGVIPTGAPFSPSATTFTITASSGGGGVVDPAGVTIVAQGGSQEYSITPNGGFNIASLTVDGSPIATSTTYTFTDVQGNHTISATFVAIPVTFTVTASAGVNGAVDPSGVTTILQGGTQGYTITPNGGYEIETLSIDGSPIATSTSYTFSDVQANHTISATFIALPVEPNTFTITATTGIGGNVAPLGATVVTQGATQIYAITPDVGYDIETLTIDGSPIATSTSYTFTDVQSNHTINASFVAIPLVFTITASTGGNGTVSPDGATSVTQGNSQGYTITADLGYTIDTLLIDGAPVPNSTTYTFSDVQANHTISATFSLVPVTFTIYSTTGANGLVAPLGATVVAQGGSQSFSITPDAGYAIESLRVDSLLIATSTTYDFTNVQSTHSIEAMFVALPTPPPPPGTPNIPSGSLGQLVKITFSGSAFVGGRVYIIDKEVLSEKLVGQEVIPGKDGLFSISFTGILQGLHSFGLSIKDKDRRISQTKFFLIDNTNEKLVIKDILVPPTIDMLNGQVTRGKNATVFGYASPGNTTHVYVDDILTGKVLAGNDGAYKYEILTSALDFGQHKVQTRQVDTIQDRESDPSTLRTFFVSRLTVVRADFNGDGKIDIKDWSIFLFRWGAKDSVGRESIDLNGDGKIDISDFSIFIKTIKK